MKDLTDKAAFGIKYRLTPTLKEVEVLMTQRTQYSLNKEKTFNQIVDPYII